MNIVASLPASYSSRVLVKVRGLPAASRNPWPSSPCRLGSGLSAMLRALIRETAMSGRARTFAAERSAGSVSGFRSRLCTVTLRDRPVGVTVRVLIVKTASSM